MNSRSFQRLGSQTVYIRCYDAADGYLSFVAMITAGPNSGKATTPPPSWWECEQVVPEGWTLFEEGGSIRAMPKLEDGP